MLRGNKIVIKQIINKVFIKLISLLSVSLERLLYSIFFKLRVFVEIKKLKRGRRIYLVPIPLNKKRRIHKILVWLFEAISQVKSKVSLEDCLYIELKKILLSEPSLATDSYVKNNKTVRESRANLHYRW